MGSPPSTSLEEADVAHDTRAEGLTRLLVDRCAGVYTVHTIPARISGYIADWNSIACTRASSVSSEPSCDIDGALRRSGDNRMAEMTPAEVEAFPSLTAEQIARIAPFASERDVADGESLWEAGDRNRPLFVVLRGE